MENETVEVIGVPHLQLEYHCLKQRVPYVRVDIPPAGKTEDALRLALEQVVERSDLVLFLWDGQDADAVYAMGHCISSRVPFRIAYLKGGVKKINKRFFTIVGLCNTGQIYRGDMI